MEFSVQEPSSSAALITFFTMFKREEPRGLPEGRNWATFGLARCAIALGLLGIVRWRGDPSGPYEP